MPLYLVQLGEESGELLTHPQVTTQGRGAHKVCGLSTGNIEHLNGCRDPAVREQVHRPTWTGPNAVVPGGPPISNPIVETDALRMVLSHDMIIRGPWGRCHVPVPAAAAARLPELVVRVV